MKAELNLPDQLLEQIADKVAERLRPSLTNNNNHDELFDVQRLAEYLGVRPQWIYEKVHLRAIPFYKVGKYPRFKKSEIDAWLEKTRKR